jgi:hypothetical protein
MCPLAVILLLVWACKFLQMLIALSLECERMLP